MLDSNVDPQIYKLVEKFTTPPKLKHELLVVGDLKIMLKEHSCGWVAKLEHDPKGWVRGGTRAQALGKLLLEIAKTVKVY